ncbi:MAG: hypothetical protein KAJ98_11265 [Spirochaetaceae bacterium]|nr:hypothetical protein [Spirochaetaceae bacterium]
MLDRRRFVFAGLSVIILVLLFSCSFSPGNPAEDRIITLNVGGSSMARLLGVTEYDVMSLDIEVYDPDGELLWNTEWLADEGPQTYQLQVGKLGVHEIVVVHHGIYGDESVSAEESILFTIASMIITVIDITPGAIGVIHVAGGGTIVDECPIVGTWEGIVTMTWEEYDGDEVIDSGTFDVKLVMTFDPEGNAEMLSYEVIDGVPSTELLEDMSMRGTYECPVDGVLIGEWAHWYSADSGEWELMDESDQWEVEVEFSNGGDTLTFIMDFGDGPFSWVLNRI